jgi:hypothetical protein
LLSFEAFAREAAVDRTNRMVRHVVGNAGTYYAAYQLCLRGWNVMPTACNARGIDLLAYDAAGTKFRGFQVKALSKRSPVPLGRSVESLMGDWWIIVTGLSAAGNPNCFVMSPKDVRQRAHVERKTGAFHTGSSRIVTTLRSSAIGGIRSGGAMPRPSRCNRRSGR